MASGPRASWQIDGETVESVTDFIFLVSKITADCDCSLEMKRRLLLGRKVITNLEGILKSRGLSRVKQLTGPGWMHETSARTWCSGRTWREWVGREVGGGIGLGKTCEPKTFSFQCTTKFTTNNNNNKKTDTKKKKKQRHYFINKRLSSQGYGFSSSHVWMWELDCKESWVLKNWCFWSVVLEKTLESPLDSKEIQPVHPKGNQSWIFIGRTDAEALATWCKELSH